MTWPVPTLVEQILFLRNVQRLLAEGQFTASYKFALLYALADLAVLKGEDTDAALVLDTRDIAAQFVELYWRQSRPFPLGRGGRALQQNTGKQAAIVAKIARSREECAGSLFRFRRSSPRRWAALVADVAGVVCKMPLWKLQPETA